MSLQRLLEPIKNRIRLLIGRCIIGAITNDADLQKLTVDCLDNETLSDVPRIQEYGLDTYPKKNMNALALFFNGRRDFGYIIKAFTRDYRPSDLAEGDVCLYDWNDQRIWLTSSGIKITDKSGNEIEMTSTGIKVTGSSVEVNGTTDLAGPPSTTGGFCAIPACLFTGAPHVAKKVN